MNTNELSLPTKCSLNDLIFADNTLGANESNQSGPGVLLNMLQHVEQITLTTIKTPPLHKPSLFGGRPVRDVCLHAHLKTRLRQQSDRLSPSASSRVLSSGPVSWLSVFSGLWSSFSYTVDS